MKVAWPREKQGIVCIVAIVLCFSSAGFPASFSLPVKITDGSAKYQLSRTSDAMMALDSSGTLHVAYWSGGIATSPSTPSFIYYRNWTAGGGWSPQISIDDSVVASQHVGGRHPSLAVAPDDTIWVVWHDHRNCTAAGNWIDNIEIYGDFEPNGGSFSSTDLRLTTSSAAHLGDDGYTSKIVPHPSGRLSVAWYDFNADQNVSDIYLKTSDALGAFNLGDTMASMRMTSASARGNVPAFTVPDLTVDSAGTRHLAWAGGTGSDVNLYYAEAAVGATSVSAQLVASSATDFFDPPHIAAAPNGDVWIAYGDESNANENIALRRRRFGQPAFDAPIIVTTNAAREYSVDLKIDAANKVHLVWVDLRSGRHIYYGIYDPSSPGLIDETRLTSSSGSWIRPSLFLGNSGEVFVLFEQDINIATGDIWFTTSYTANEAMTWKDYE